MRNNNTANYFDRQFENSKFATKHTEEMQQQYKKEIEEAVYRSVIYDTHFYNSVYPLNDKEKHEMKVVLMDTDSVSGIFEARNNYQGRIGVLNFASYKIPGGMFLAGSIAQEECLCRESFLYNVLSDKALAEYYKWNNEHLNRALYLNRAVWTPDVLFIRDEKEVKCDVVTCAAPNIGAAEHYCNVSSSENSNVLKDRVRYVLDIFKHQNIDIPVLGAWGAGVFGQDAAEVAERFKELLQSGQYPFKTVVFAILPGPNFEAFENVLVKNKE